MYKTDKLLVPGKSNEDFSAHIHGTQGIMERAIWQSVNVVTILTSLAIVADGVLLVVFIEEHIDDHGVTVGYHDVQHTANIHKERERSREEKKANKRKRKKGETNRSRRLIYIP